MIRKLYPWLMVLGIAGSLFMAGCKEDDEEDPAPHPIVGHWVASNPIDYGFTQLEQFFNEDNSYRQFGAISGLGDYDERGTWAFTQADSVRFQIATVNGQPPQGVNTYSATYDLTGTNNNTLVLQFRDDQGTAVNVTFARQ